jgi:hypothetical protein
MAKKKVSTGFQLPGPNDFNEPPTTLGSYRTLIYGRKAIGKTSLASCFPGAVVGMLERGRRGLKVRQIQLSTWDDCLNYRDACLDDDTVETLVFDTVDVLYDLCLAHECENRGISHPGDVKDFGSTWKAIKNAFRDFFDPISESEKGLVALSHERKDTVEVRSGANYDMLVPTCSKQAFEVVQETFDIVIYYGYHGTRRALSVRPLTEDANTEVWCCVNPQEVFMDPNGEPLSIILAPNDARRTYETLEDAFNNGVWDAVRGEPEPVKPEKKKVK